ncbi:hypothetical protein AHAS_Ahas07G0160900 [Arachis hypogaea]
MEDESSENRKQARLTILELANMISVPMSLNAVVRLNVADAIWQGGTNNPLSAIEILKRVLPAGNGDAENLQRVLRMLASYGVFNEHTPSGAGGERKYSLTDVGKTLVTDSEGLSFAPYVLQHHQDALMRAWPLVHEAVVDPSKEPFERANGEAAYSYYLKQGDMNELMVKAMSGVSVPFMRAMLQAYDGFRGVERLVDVGGSGGDCLRMILQKHPMSRKASTLTCLKWWPKHHKFQLKRISPMEYSKVALFNLNMEEKVVLDSDVENTGALQPCGVSE